MPSCNHHTQTAASAYLRQVLVHQFLALLNQHRLRANGLRGTINQSINRSINQSIKVHGEPAEGKPTHEGAQP